MFKQLIKRAAAKLVQSKVADGKLTYAGILAVVLPAVNQFLGVEIAPDVVLDTIQAIGTLVATVGYIRRVLKNKEAPAPVV